MNCYFPILILARRYIKLSLFIFFLICKINVWGQVDGAVVLKGHVLDSILQKDCSLAVVAILTSDSCILKFTRTKKDGRFILNNIVPGDYLIWISHPSFSEFVKPISISNKSTFIELPTFYMAPKSQSLEAVVVSADMPPSMKGDTLEFNTAHIKTKVNATIEELLKRLPGVQVDQQGNIYVNGEKIERLLVDGEVLFGGDPTIITKNLNADMIGKVQVLNKKSEQAEFTGIDDGKRTKTLNLTLKDDSKKGVFINVEAGGDFRKYYAGSMFSGSFNGARQMAIFGKLSNHNGSGRTGGNSVGGDLIDALGASAGSGIPRVISTGVQYSNKWDQDHINGSYQYGNSTRHPFSINVSRQVLPDSIYKQIRGSKSDNFQSSHATSISYDYVADSLNRFRFFISGDDGQGSNILIDSSLASFNDTIVNYGTRNIKSNVSNRNYSGNIMWSLRGRRNRSRHFSLTAGLSKQNNVTDGILYAKNVFFKRDMTEGGSDTVDQRKIINANSLNFDCSANYVSPISKNLNLGIGYGFNINDGSSIFSTYGRADGKYDQFVDSVSSNYDNRLLNHKASFNLQSNARAFNFLLATDAIYFTYHQEDRSRAFNARYHYWNFVPRVEIRYTVNKYKGISFNYLGTTIQPSLQQLQPIQGNPDPLHIEIGNPALHPSFSNVFLVDYHSFKPMIFRVGLNSGFTTNSISTRTTTDTLGKQISQAVNTNGTWTIGFHSSVNFKLKKVKLDIGLNGFGNYNRSQSYVNAELSKNDLYFVGGGIQVKRFSELYNISISSLTNYTFTRNSINSQAPIHYWTRYVNAESGLFFVKNWEIGSSLVYKWRQKIGAEDNHNVSTLWNAYAKTDFFANRLSIRWQINDILGQNAGISRSVTANTTNDNTYNVLGRYWMLTASYRFVHHK